MTDSSSAALHNSNTMCSLPLPPSLPDFCAVSAKIRCANKKCNSTQTMNRNISFRAQFEFSLQESSAIIFCSPFLRPANYSLNIEICCLMRTIWKLSGFLLCRFVAYILCDSRPEIRSKLSIIQRLWVERVIETVQNGKKVHVCRSQIAEHKGEAWKKLPTRFAMRSSVYLSEVGQCLEFAQTLLCSGSVCRRWNMNGRMGMKCLWWTRRQQLARTAVHFLIAQQSRIVNAEISLEGCTRVSACSNDVAC